MRYTENSHDIQNPADLIRVASSCVILSLFRMTNEYSKRIMFLGKEKLKIHFGIAFGINILLLLGEFIYRFVFSNRVIVVSETHFIPLVISLIGIVIIYIIAMKSQILDLTDGLEIPNPVEDTEDDTVGIQDEISIVEDVEDITTINTDSVFEGIEIVGGTEQKTGYDESTNNYDSYTSNIIDKDIDFDMGGQLNAKRLTELAANTLNQAHDAEYHHPTKGIQVPNVSRPNKGINNIAKPKIQMPPKPNIKSPSLMDDDGNLTEDITQDEILDYHSKSREPVFDDLPETSKEMEQKLQQNIENDEFNMEDSGYYMLYGDNYDEEEDTESSYRDRISLILGKGAM